MPRCQARVNATRATLWTIRQCLRSAKVGKYCTQHARTWAA